MNKELNINGSKFQNGHQNCHQNRERVLGIQEKQFIPRNSLFTDLYENNIHIRCIYRIFVTVLYLLYFKSILAEIVAGKPITYGIKYVVKGFKDLHNVIILWSFMMTLTLLIYPAFCVWSKTRKAHLTDSLFLKLWNVTGVLGVLVYCSIILIVPIRIRGVSTAMASNLIIVSEQMRFLMKTHAFVRSNVPKVLYKGHADTDFNLPCFRTFLYFHFAPTFIYRDNYPRTENIRWKYVMMMILEFFGVIIWFGFLFGAVIEKYQDFGLKEETWSSLLLLTMETMLYSPFIFIAGGYILLHTWMNIWAELLCFADRKFYEDWWNSTNFTSYYRSWNLVVYGYIHEYVYKDLVRFAINSKPLAAACIILISGIVHEYIISFSTGFFCPVLASHFICFSLPLTFMKVDKNVVFANYLFVFFIITGTGIETASYAMEYFARQNCPIERERILDYFQMRMFSCNGLDL